jgi:hypothetical protein
MQWLGVARLAPRRADVASSSNTNWGAWLWQSEAQAQCMGWTARHGQKRAELNHARMTDVEVQLGVDFNA